MSSKTIVRPRKVSDSPRKLINEALADIVQYLHLPRKMLQYLALQQLCLKKSSLALKNVQFFLIQISMLYIGGYLAPTGFFSDCVALGQNRDNRKIHILTPPSIYMFFKLAIPLLVSVLEKYSHLCTQVRELSCVLKHYL